MVSSAALHIGILLSLCLAVDTRLPLRGAAGSSWSSLQQPADLLSSHISVSTKPTPGARVVCEPIPACNGTAACSGQCAGKCQDVGKGFYCERNQATQCCCSQDQHYQISNKHCRHTQNVSSAECSWTCCGIHAKQCGGGIEGGCCEGDDQACGAEPTPTEHRAGHDPVHSNCCTTRRYVPERQTQLGCCEHDVGWDCDTRAWCCAWAPSIRYKSNMTFYTACLSPKDNCSSQHSTCSQRGQKYDRHLEKGVWCEDRPGYLANSGKTFCCVDPTYPNKHNPCQPLIGNSTHPCANYHGICRDWEPTAEPGDDTAWGYTNCDKKPERCCLVSDPNCYKTCVPAPPGHPGSLLERLSDFEKVLFLALAALPLCICARCFWKRRLRRLGHSLAAVASSAVMPSQDSLHNLPLQATPAPVAGEAGTLPHAAAANAPIARDGNEPRLDTEWQPAPAPTQAEPRRHGVFAVSCEELTPATARFDMAVQVIAKADLEVRCRREAIDEDCINEICKHLAGEVGRIGHHCAEPPATMALVQFRTVGKQASLPVDCLMELRDCLAPPLVEASQYQASTCSALDFVGVQDLLARPDDSWSQSSGIQRYIKQEDLEVSEQDCLGTGGFGAVYLATVKWTESSEPVRVAAKRLREADHRAFWHEVNVLHELLLSRDFPHPHILFPRGVCPRCLVIVTEFCSLGNLEAFVEQTQATNSPLDLKQQVQALWQIANGCVWIKQKCLVHRDLKPKNILISAPENSVQTPEGRLNFKAKIADFGLAMSVSTGSYTQFGCGTRPYMAPEVRQENVDFCGSLPVQYSMDVYSFGWVVLSTMRQLARVECNHLPKPPLLEDSEEAMDTHLQDLEGILPAETLAGIPDIKKLILKCCHPRSIKRPSMGDIEKKLSAIRERGCPAGGRAPAEAVSADLMVTRE